MPAVNIKSSIRLQEYSLPRDYLVIDSYLPTDELKIIWQEVLGLENRLSIGLPRHDAAYTDLKRNKNTVIYADSKVSGRQNRMSRLFQQALFSRQLLMRLETTKSPLFRLLQHCEAPHLHISSYQNGHHYGFHSDVNEPVNITIVFFICREPKMFSGGNFEFNFGGSKKKVAFRNNRLLIFASNTRHRVTPVKLKTSHYADSRFSIQVWPQLITHGGKLPAHLTGAYQKNSISSYLKPRFKISPDRWNKLKGVLQQPNAKNIKLESAAFVKAAEPVLTALIANLRYLTRAFFDGQQFKASIVWSKNLSALEEPICQVVMSQRKDGHCYSFGYSLFQSKTLSLHVFLKLKKGRKEIWFGELPAAPSANVETACDQFKSLLDRLMRATGSR